MTFDITKYKRTSEYNKYLDSIDYNTSCIEQCVSDIEEKYKILIRERLITLYNLIYDI